jgi:high potential iron-sulfur protein
MSEKKSSDLSRREFFAAAGGVTLASLLSNAANAAELPALLETDSIAVSMGYKTDTAKVDNKKYATHKANQACANCRFFQGDDAMPSGPCQIFAGKSVSTKGWCQVYAAK